MRQHHRLGSVVLSGGLFLLLVEGCGHADNQTPGASAGTSSTSTGGTIGNGGSTGNPSGNAPSTGNTGGMGTPGGGSPSATGGMPTSPTAGTTGVGTGGEISAGGTPPQLTCEDAPSQQYDPKTMPGYTQPPDPMVETLFNEMSQQQRIAQMQGIPVGNKDFNDIERSPDVMVGGVTVRGYRYRDAGHGVNLDAGQDNRDDDGNNFSTAFPQQSTRGASWDLDLEWRIGLAIGDETVASRNNMLLAPCMNIIRHPYWGRTQETYGEDVYHMGRFASAFTAGLQQFVVGCAKHYAANNVELNRANQDALMDEQTLREIYGRHFEMVVRDGGIGCVMAAYNKINGVKSTQNAHLLTTILRDDFGFRGLVISDWWAMPGDQGPIESATAVAQAAEAALAGLDIEVPWTLNYGSLSAAIAQDPSGKVAEAVDKAAKRILEQKFRFKTALSTDPWGPKEPTSTLNGGSIATNQAHLDLAEEAAVKSAVLLKNGAEGAPVLPLAGNQSIAVVGADVMFRIKDTTPPKSGTTFRFATDVPVGDRGSSRVNADPAHSVGPAAGIQQIGMMHGATVTSGNSAAAAASADVAVVVVGLTPGDEGEEYAIEAGGDRSSLDLPHGQNDLVNAVLDLMKPTIIIIEAGSIVNLPWLNHANQNQATIWAGYAGMRAGLAYGKLLFGEANFSGKMPLAWPKEEDLNRLIPFKDQPNSTTMGYFFGYREYDRVAAAGMPVELVFPFGHGLSYSTFSYSNLSVPCGEVTKNAIVDVTVDITNDSDVDGEEIAMLFVQGPPPAEGVTGKRPVKELKSFAKVRVPAKQTVTAHLPVRVQDLKHWEGDANGKWIIDNGTYTVLVGGNAASLTQMGTFTVRD